jgi:hypothetical protein
MPLYRINSKYCSYFDSYQNAYYLTRTSARCHQKAQDVFKHLAQKLTQLVSLFFAHINQKTIILNHLRQQKTYLSDFFTSQPNQFCHIKSLSFP